MGQKLDLAYILAQAQPESSINDQALWLRSLIEWIRYRNENQDQGSQPTARIKFLLQFLDRHPEWKQKSAETIRNLLRQSNSTRLYSETGLPNHPTFSSEFWARIGLILIPHYDDPKKLSHLLAYLFYDLDDAESFRQVPESLITEIMSWLRTGLKSGEGFILHWREEMLSAAQILLNRAVTCVLREDIAERAPDFFVSSHPLLRAQKLLWDLSLNQRGSNEDALFEEIISCLHEGQNLILKVRKNLESTGVSVDLMYQLDRVKSDLLRLQRLFAVLRTQPQDSDELQRSFLILWLDLLRGLRYDQDPGLILRRHLGVLSRKIVERTGSTGEHYSVQNWSEYKAMLWAGFGGGVITAATAFIKYSVNTHGWPLFLEFVYISLNYSLSFLLMHMMGFKLATKQPSATASHLATRLKQDEESQDEEAFIEEVMRICRSQFAALIGNLAGVIPAAFLAGALLIEVTGEPFLSSEKAEHVLMTLHPIYSGTIFYASITGVLLWLSSLIAGWAENGSAFYQIPRLLASHPLLLWSLGKEKTSRVAQKFESHISGVTGAISFGVLLGFVPLVGRFFGLPLDIRHVTLSTGIATSAFQTLGLGSPLLFPFICGIFLIAFLNFNVSFFLSLMVALRAREVSLGQARKLFKEVGRRLIRRPHDFFLPKKNLSPKSTL